MPGLSFRIARQSRSWQVHQIFSARLAFADISARLFAILDAIVLFLGAEF